MHTRILQSECYNLFGLVFVWVEALRPSQQLLSHVRTEVFNLISSVGSVKKQNETEFHGHHS